SASGLPPMSPQREKGLTELAILRATPVSLKSAGDSVPLSTPPQTWFCWECSDRWIVARFVTRLLEKQKPSRGAYQPGIFRATPYEVFQWLSLHQGHKKVERLE